MEQSDAESLSLTFLRMEFRIISRMNSIRYLLEMKSSKTELKTNSAKVALVKIIPSVGAFYAYSHKTEIITAICISKGRILVKTFRSKASNR
ncbi:hypothetical protein CDAR_263051 [Caerostris darwini]|uniref:Uncharacterized protein n=1 Tax=Caerostris darwini TaxID=1538125 RepID=A0AAV4RVY9_9ARAC|nr:hypothetical protein CDAR_263051 [Caerostris darwini]